MVTPILPAPYPIFRGRADAVSAANQITNPGPDWGSLLGNVLSDVGYGMTQSPTLGGAFGVAGQRMHQLEGQRAATAQQKRDKAEQQLAVNRTAQFLEQKFPDIAEMVRQGMPLAQGWDMALQKMRPADPLVLSQGETAFDPATGQPMFSAPAGISERPVPTSIQEYEYARGQGYTGTFEQYELEKQRAGATSIDFNQNQGVAAGFADRMAAANDILNDPQLLPAMTDPTKPAIAALPLAGNYFVGPEYQMAEQAQRDFVNAVLRRESGAVISPSEFENAKRQYFPQPGDSPEVIQQKAQNRKIAIEGVMRSAGPAYQAPPSIGGVGTTFTYNPLTGELE